jgi:hypothetical protein
MADVPYIVKGRTRKEAKCPKCGRMVSTQGMAGHMRFVHKKEIGSKGRPVEKLVEASMWWDPMQGPRDLAEYLLKIFKGDDKKLIETIKDVKKDQDEED